MDRLIDPNFKARYGVLYENFKYEYRYFYRFLLAKALFTGLVIGFSQQADNPTAAITLLLLSEIFLTAVLAHFRPFLYGLRMGLEVGIQVLKIAIIGLQYGYKNGNDIDLKTTPSQQDLAWAHVILSSILIFLQVVAVAQALYVLAMELFFEDPYRVAYEKSKSVHPMADVAVGSSGSNDGSDVAGPRPDKAATAIPLPQAKSTSTITRVGLDQDAA